MTSDDDRPGGDTTTESRPGQRRMLVAAASVVSLAVLGGGAYVTTSSIISKNSGSASDLAAVSTLSTVPAVSPSASTSASASDTEARRGGGPIGSPASAPSTNAAGKSLPPQVVEQIKEARERMAKDGVKVDHPIEPKVTSATEDIQRTTKGSLKEDGIVRTVTARRDLTGQAELAYVAGGVRNYKNVPCSQTFQFSTNPRPAKKDTLLMCWRTSPTKSVIAMVVDPKGHPSRDKAIDAIEKSWRSLG